MFKTDMLIIDEYEKNVYKCTSAEQTITIQIHVSPEKRINEAKLMN